MLTRNTTKALSSRIQQHIAAVLPPCTRASGSSRCPIYRFFSSASKPSLSDDIQQFKKELKEVIEEERESQRDKAERKYNAWKAQQEKNKRQQTNHAPEHQESPESTFCRSSWASETLSNHAKPPSQEVHTIGPQDTHFNIGLKAQSESHMNQIVQTLEESLKVQLLAAPYASLSVAKSYEELGMLCHQNMDFTKAIKYYRHALRIHELLAEEKVKKSGESIDMSMNPLKVASNESPEMSNDARDWNSQKNKSFTGHIKSAVNIEKTLRGESSAFNHSSETSDSNRFRYSFVTDTHTGGASETIRESVGSFDTARSLSYLGVCYRDAGKLEKARELLTAALHMKYATVGQYHESTAETLNNLGALYHAEGNYQDAADCYEDAIRILIGTLGGSSTTSPYLAMAYYNLGVALKEYERIPQSIVALSKALRISSSSQGECHPMTARIQKELESVKETITDTEKREVK